MTSAESSTGEDGGIANDNADWGRTVETTACERYDLERISGDQDEPWWYDARTTAWVGDIESAFGAIAPDTVVEIKGAKFRIENGSPRCGRWWIAESSHQRLLEEDGEYVLAVYEPGEGVVEMVVRPAWWVDRLVTTWSRCGSHHYAERSAQIPWSRAFDKSAVGISKQEGSA